MEIIAFIYLVRRDKAQKVTTQGVAPAEYADLAVGLNLVNVLVYMPPSFFNSNLQICSIPLLNAIPNFSAL